MTAFRFALYSALVAQWKTIIWLTLLGFGWQAFAHEPADGSIWATLGPQVLQTHPRNHNFSAPILNGFSLIAEGDLNSNGGIEITGSYINQLFSMRQEGKNIDEIGHRIYIVSGYRLWATPLLSGALGFFSSYSVGSGYIYRSEFGNTPPPETSAHVITAYGFDVSLQWEPWRSGRWATIVDARYSYSITSRPGEDSNFYSLLIGLKYHVQSPELTPP